MTRSEWKDMIEELLVGVERELRVSAPIKSKVALKAFRRRLNEGRIARKHKHFEKELEAFLQSEPFLRGAAKRYLRKKAGTVFKAVIATLNQARQVLAKNRTKRRA